VQHGRGERKHSDAFDHALHDAEHHLLDVRRGIARQQLRR
jgi:hypothetical protein